MNKIRLVVSYLFGGLSLTMLALGLCLVAVLAFPLIGAAALTSLLADEVRESGGNYWHDQGMAVFERFYRLLGISDYK